MLSYISGEIWRNSHDKGECTIEYKKDVRNRSISLAKNVLDWPISWSNPSTMKVKTELLVNISHSNLDSANLKKGNPLPKFNNILY